MPSVLKTPWEDKIHRRKVNYMYINPLFSYACWEILDLKTAGDDRQYCFPTAYICILA